MTKHENDIRKISKTMVLMDYLQSVLFGVAVSNMIYWGFVGAYYSNYTLIFSMFCMIGLIGILEYAFHSEKTSAVVDKIRISFAGLFVVVLAFFQYSGIMTLYMPTYKAEIYTKIIEQLNNNNSELIQLYKNELFRNIDIIEPSNNYIQNIWFMYQPEYAFFIMLSLIITLFSVWFTIKFINNNREFIQIFVNSQKEKLQIRSKYKEREYEEIKKNEAIINSIKNLTNNFQLKGESK